MNQIIFENSAVIRLLSKHSGKPASQINLNSTLLADLGIDGDDAWELFEQAHQDFKLDLSQFQFEKHFRNEPCHKGFIYHLRKFRFGDVYKASQKTKITVAMFINACMLGSCIELLDKHQA
ncbi:DUF1493 family protein [Bacterioplanoides sp.]|uniref:DUF1493 family protein n=1 Tax=Bacterioplanoides sp. TaxID=2066072 RepID=UPI003B5AAB42